MGKILVFLMCALILETAFPAGKIQNSDVKSEAELITAGATKAQLINDTKIYVTGNSINKRLDQAIIDGDIGEGGGSGINYILASNGDVTTGWATYADADAATPVDGTGGSPNVTFASSSSSPLIGTNSFLFTKDAFSRRGQGVAYPFTIDPGYQAQVLRVSFPYSSSASYLDTVSGNLINSDMQVFVYDVTNSVLIPVIDQNVGASSLGQYVGSFQTSSNSTSYRLILHVASVNAAAYTLKLDNVVVGPQTLIKGAVVTGWQSFTPTGTWTTGTWTGNYRRVGDQLEVTGRFTTSTAPTGSFNINLPFGLSVDTAKLQSSITSLTPLGQANLYDVSTGTNYIGEIRTDSATQLRVYILTTSGSNQTSNTLSPASPITIAVNDRVDFNFSVPVVGWSSNMTLSEDSGNRLIASSYTGNAGTAVTALVTNIPFVTRAYDLTSSWDGSTFTAPETGYYRVAGAIRGAAALGSAALYLFKNGTIVKSVTSNGNTGTQLLFNGEIQLKKGDVLALRSDQGFTLLNIVPDHHIAISKISSPQTLAGSETVAVRAVQSSGQSFPNVGIIDVTWDATKTYDTHNALNTTTGVFTAPATGRYRVYAKFKTVSVPWTVGAEFAVIVNKNGVNRSSEAVVIQAAASVETHPKVQDTVDMVKGDTLKIQAAQSRTGGNTVLSGVASLNYLTIELVK